MEVREKENRKSEAWWCTPIILTLRRLRQEYGS
jgi:hypothetical protein